MTTHTAPAATSPTSRPRTGVPPAPTVLLLDAAVTALNGVAYLALAPVLDDLLGLPAPWLRAAGAFLLAYAAVVWGTGTRRPVPRPAAWAVVTANELWVVGSVVVAVGGVGTPGTVGTVWVLAQAAVVAAFALLQWRALRRG